MQRKIFLLVAFCSIPCFAENIPFAIIGGGNNSGYGYAGILVSDGTVTPETVHLPSQTPSIRTVAINNQGVSLVGCGNNTGSSYIARISAHTLDPQALNFPTNLVRGVAINDFGVGCAGCGDIGNGYAARIMPKGINPEPITLPVGTNGIRRVAINNSGAMIIGGCDQLAPNSGYAAYIPPASTTPQQIGGNTNILYVAMNQSGAGLIGGGGNTSGYAAFVLPNSTVLQTINLPIGTPSIYAVDINNAGHGIIGASGTGGGYVALVTLNDSNPQAVDVPLNIPIFGAAINNAGVGLVGGGTTNGYAALITPDGNGMTLPLPATKCPILDVAINDQGVGLIGGEDLTGDNTYVALVAPDGTLTPLVIPSGNGVNFVAINDAFVTSVGPYSSAFNTQLAFSNALEPRMHQCEAKQCVDDCCTSIMTQKKVCDDEHKCAVWVTGFGNHVRSKANENVPLFTNKIGGLLAAFDYKKPDLLIGFGVGYGSNAIHYSEHRGHGHLHEGVACIYSAFKERMVAVKAILWGGGYRVEHDRRMLSTLSAKTTFSGGICAPHIELSIPCTIGARCTSQVEPFVLLNWINNWQGGLRENGSSGFNLVMGKQYRSLLYSEAGMRLFQDFKRERGEFIFEEKISYVNLAPFHVRKAKSYFMIPTSQFSLVTDSSQKQNLCGIELSGSFIPCGSAVPFVQFSFHGLFGSSYTSYFVGATLGKNF